MSKSFKFLLAALVGVALVLFLTPDADAAKRKPRLVSGSTLNLATGSTAYGWQWLGSDPIDVYDASLYSTQPTQLKLAEAAAEWSQRSRADLAVASSSSGAEILVRTTNFDPCGIPGAVVCIYAPRVEYGAADGQCQIEIRDDLAREAVGEYLALHTIGRCLGLPRGSGNSVMNTQVDRYSFLTRPTSRDYSAMASLYGR